MMGILEAPARLFYDFDLGAQMPADHMLHQIDRFLDVGVVRESLHPHYIHLGRPSIDPELIVQMLVIGYTLGIRSKRRPCEVVHLNLAYRWSCRLGLDGKVPDQYTFSKYCHGKFRDSDLLRVVFEAIVARCLSKGLVGGHGFAFDASLIEADVDRQNSSAQADWDADANNPHDAPRAVREYLDVLDDKAFGAATPVKPKFTSHADPASQWIAACKGPAIFSCSINYLIDTDYAVIVNVEATRSIRTAEVGAAQTKVDRAEECFGNKPDWLVADTAYGPAENLARLVKRSEIIPSIPLIDKSERTDGTFTRSNFEWGGDSERYACPEGEHLVITRRNYSDLSRKEPRKGRRRYRATNALCSVCPSKQKMLSEGQHPVHRPRGARRCVLLCPAGREIRFQPEGSSQTQEGRNAFRPPQTDIETGAAQASGALRGSRRIYSRRYRTEPPKTRKAKTANDRNEDHDMI